MPRKKRARPVETPVSSEPVFNVLDLGDTFSEPAPEVTAPVLDTPTIEFKSPSAETSTEDKPGEKRKYTRRTKKTDENGEPLIDGEMLLTLIDLIIPMIITTSHNMFSGEKPISPDDLMLTEKQKLSMQRFADKVAERIDINANPYAVLFIGLGGIYTVNYLKEKNKGVK
jgi:hypothetical protein